MKKVLNKGIRRNLSPEESRQPNFILFLMTKVRDTRVYLEYALRSFQQNLVYPVDVFMGILTSLITIFVQVSIWRAIYFVRESVPEATLTQMITYVLLFSAYKLGIAWTPASVFWFIVVLMGATLVQASLMTIPAILAFWFTRSRNLGWLTIGVTHRFMQYPITIYGKFIRIFLTFAIPFAFVSFYPSLYFLNKESLSIFHPLVQYLTPIVGLALFAFTMFLWNQGRKRYQSTGS